MSLRTRVCTTLAAALVALPAAQAVRPATALAQLGDLNGAVARVPFERGLQHYERRDFAAALAEFRASHALVPSPNSRLYIARSLRELGRAVEAYREFQATAADADARAVAEPRYAATAQAARGEAQRLLARVALVTIAVGDVPPGAVILVNGQAANPSTWNTPIAYEPGTLVIDAQAPGHTPFRASAAVGAGVHSRVDVRFGGGQANPMVGGPPQTGWTMNVQTNDAQRLSSYGGGAQGPSNAGPALTVAGVTGIGVGALLLVGGTVAGAAALAIHGGLTRDCNGGQCDLNEVPDAEERIAAGQTAVTLANVGWITGGALVVVGAVLYGIGRAIDAPADLRLQYVRATPFIDPTRGLAGLQGRF